ncbi:MAG TPA: alpha/beta hydrolase-fold protein [Mobilitalea sp.]|nr:alpha/beta hydrolase-fold protein [Mobilitalea sp.]
MKQLIMLCAITILMITMLAGCSNSEVEEGKAVIPEEDSTSAAQATITPTLKIVSTTLTPAVIQKPTATPVPVITLTPTPGTSGSPTMAEISEAYMSNLKITEDCPSSIYEKRDDVTYGTVVHKTYNSKTTGLARGVNIILPANYSESKQYPVLYLLHGIGGNESTLLDDSNCKIVQIIGNLISEGMAEEMIVVLPNIFATSDIGKTAGFDKESVAAYDNFINDLTNDLMPYIEENYSILTGRESQAIAGFSMGGREDLYIGFTRPDLFGYVLGMAPAPGLTPGKDWAMEHPGQLQEDDLKIDDSNDIPYVIMICCGTNDGMVGSFPESYHNILTHNGVNHIWYEVPGADHDAQTIRSGLYNFSSAIFHVKE